MFDWNGDKKHDGRDDSLFHTVVDKPGSDQSRRTVGCGGPLMIVLGLKFSARRKILCKRFSTKSRILLEQLSSRLPWPLKNQSLWQAWPACAPLAA